LAGAGANVISGGSGDDLLNGGAGIDIASYYDSPRGVRVSLQLQGEAQSTHGQGTDTLIGFEGLSGSAYSDRLIGSNSADVLYSGGGGDVDAQRGDTLIGGGGDDQIASGGWYGLLDGGAGDDVLGQNDYIWTHQDAYAGFADTLTGGRGADIIFAGSYNEVAAYKSIKDSTVARPDQVTFTDRGDFTIDLHLIDANSAKDGDQAFRVVQDAFTHHAGELLLVSEATENGGQETWILLDVNGDGRADGKIVMIGAHAEFDHFVL
jgi:Ca2+-binding RTX toxin-like protein